MTPILLIPARLAATRLPGKPLADIGGLPMIVRVVRQAEASGVGPVAVAAGDPEIVAAYVLGRWRQPGFEVAGLIDRAADEAERIVMGG